MNGYDLTDRQKELLRKLVRYIRERKLTEPIAPVSTDQGYFIWFRGGGSLEHQGDLVGDLDALCDAGLMRVRWEKSKRLYNVKQAGYDAVDSDFEVPPSYAGAQSRPRQPVNWGKWEVIVGVIAVLIALGAWLLPDAKGWLSALLSQSPTATSTSNPTHTPIPSTATPTNTPLAPTAIPTFTPAPPTPTRTPKPTATSTAIPRPTNTPPPTPAPTPTPTYTPVPPTPTRLLNTPPGTVLNMGETWYADGVELRLAEAIFDPDGLNIGRSCYIVRFEMANRSTSPLYFAMDRNQFWITDNLGQRYEMQGKFTSEPFCTFTGYSPPIEVSMEPGKKFDYNWLDGGWNMQFFVPVTDPSIKSLIVHVANLSRIANAEWQIQIR